MRVYNLGMSRPEEITLKPGRYLIIVEGDLTPTITPITTVSDERPEPSFRDLLKGPSQPLTTARQEDAAKDVRAVTKMIGDKAALAEGAGVDELLDLEDDTRYLKLTAMATRYARISRRQIARLIFGVISQKVEDRDLAIDRAEIVYNALRGSVSPKQRQLRG